MNQTVTIQPDGFVTAKVIGSLRAEGLTIPELSDALRIAYAKDPARSGDHDRPQGFREALLHRAEVHRLVPQHSASVPRFSPRSIRSRVLAGYERRGILTKKRGRIVLLRKVQ